LSALKEEERKLFDELIVASRILVTVSKNAATVLSEEFEDMIAGPADAVEAILARCPSPDTAWDGIFREEDVEEQRFTPDMGIDYVERFTNSGVKVTHKQTQLSVEAYQSEEYTVNRRRAMRALRRMVTEHVAKTA